jgi:hypothetical protein
VLSPKIPRCGYSDSLKAGCGASQYQSPDCD